MTPRAIAIGASAGAISALGAILPSLPSGYPLPIFIVVHVPAATPSMLSDLFAPRCRLKTKEAEDKEPIEPGTIYFAAPDYHLLIEPNGCLSLSSDEPVLYSRPSIDVLLESAAATYRADLIGVVLSGANADGAAGLATVIACGGVGLVQAPETAEAAEMPRAALARNAQARALTLEAIAQELRSVTKGRKEIA